jgi:hypothetical protein
MSNAEALSGATVAFMQAERHLHKADLRVLSARMRVNGRAR